MKGFNTPAVDRSSGRISSKFHGVDTPSVNAFLKKLEDNAPDVDSNEPALVGVDVILYGDSISLAAPSGCCLSLSLKTMISKSGFSQQKESLFLHGSGSGTVYESMILANPQEKKLGNGVKFGDIVVLKFNISGVDKFVGSQISQEEEVEVVATKATRDEEWRFQNASNPSNSSYIHSGDTVQLIHEASNRYLSFKRKLTEIEGNFGTPGQYEGLNDFQIVTTVSRNPQLLNWTISQSSVPKYPTPLWKRPYSCNSFLKDETRKTSTDSEYSHYGPCTLSGIEPEYNCYQNASQSRDYTRPMIILNSFSLADQELIVLDDLLNAMLGFESRYICYQADDGFVFSPSREAVRNVWSDSGVSPDLVRQILSLINNVHIISTFASACSSFQAGLVSQALGNALTQILSQYDLLIAQVDEMHAKRSLSLSLLWSMLAPSSGQLISLSVFVRRLTQLSFETGKQIIGGQLLSLIENEVITAGSVQTKKMFDFIHQMAAVPYLNMLSSWLLKGSVSDVYKEFVISHDKTIVMSNLSNDYSQRYWTARYQLRNENIIPRLVPFKEKILLTGKYRNALYECLVASSQIETDVNDEDDVKFSADMTISQLEFSINSAYASASKRLLDYFVNNCSLFSHFLSLKHFFLFDHVDFLSNFLESAEIELNSVVDKLSLSRIDSICQSSMQTSSLSGDVNRERIKCKFAPFSVLQHLSMIHINSFTSIDKQADRASVNRPLKGVEALMLEYSVDWPLSIVLSRRALAKYQLLFRILFFAKHVERRLSICWKFCQEMKNLMKLSMLPSSVCHENLALVIGLTHQMLHFQQNFLFYVTFEVIEPRWIKMDSEVRECVSIDDVCAKHEEFLDCCLRDCLLSSQDHLMYLIKIMMTCLLFSERVSSLVAARSDGDITLSSQQLDVSFEREMAQSIQTEIERILSAIPISERNSESVLLAAYKARSQFRMSMTENRTDLTNAELASNKFVGSAKTLLKEFDDLVLAFLGSLVADKSVGSSGQPEAVHAQVSLSNLCTRIDYNSFYSNKLMK